MKTADFLRKHRAGRYYAKWALSVSSDMAAVWDAMIEQGKYERLLWTVTRSGVFPDSTLCRLACRFVRETPLADGRKVWDLLTDERSSKAIEVAEAYVDGKATTDELAASYAAARATAHAAADAAYAAAYTACAAARAAGAAVDAAADAACAAAHAAYAAYAAYTAYASAHAERAAYVAARAAADADAAESAQIKMIVALGNPFRKEP